MCRKEDVKMKNNFKIYLIGGIGAILIMLLGVFIIQGASNKAIALEEQVSTGESDIKVQEKRRIDLIYNLVDCVKQYDKHEAQTLKDIVEARNNGKGEIGDVTTMINAAAEAYPELKSSENYKQLMNELSTTENLIAQFRSNYNKQIKEYNRYVRKFPIRQFLSLTGYEVQEYLYLDYNTSQDAPQGLFGE